MKGLLIRCDICHVDIKKPFESEGLEDFISFKWGHGRRFLAHQLPDECGLHICMECLHEIQWQMNFIEKHNELPNRSDEPSEVKL